MEIIERNLIKTLKREYQTFPQRWNLMIAEKAIGEFIKVQVCQIRGNHNCLLIHILVAANLCVQAEIQSASTGFRRYLSTTWFDARLNEFQELCNCDPCHAELATRQYPVAYEARGRPPSRLEKFRANSVVRASSSFSKILKDKKYFNSVKNSREDSVFQGKRRLFKILND